MPKPYLGRRLHGNSQDSHSLQLQVKTDPSCEESFVKFFLITSLFLLLNPQARAEDSPQETPVENASNSEQVTVKAKKLVTEPGSATILDKEHLDIHKYTDLNRALKAVPGVQIQEEDGFGLRPNIGMRGAHPHRSRKILIMEDGIPSGPAPYAAPAAYYVPDLTLMEGIEVTKGPAAVRYGPQTIGGAINLISKSIPPDPLAFSLDLAQGSFGFRKALVGNSGHYENFSWLLLAADIGADGFKTLQGGGKTGFHKRHTVGKFRWQTSSSQALQLKLGWSDEYSPETYLGLSEQDFNDGPYQRYAASAADYMKNSHRTLQLEHFWTGEETMSRLAVYRNGFERNWNRLNGFSNPNLSIRKILNQPFGQNQHAYDVLKGTDDTLGDNDQLVIAHNNRKFYSQGVAWEGKTQWTIDGERSNELEWGIRAHQDGIQRLHTTDTLLMESGVLVPSNEPTQDGTQNKYDANSLAAFVWNTFRQNNWRWSTGLRQEWIKVELNDQGPADDDSSSTRTAIMPSLGVFHQLTPEFGWLLGVYRGMGLALADDEGNSKPEESINYESGFRWNHAQSQVDVIAFWNNYKNIKGTCSASEGCSNLDRDLSVDGGQAQIYGLEWNASHTELMGGAYWPLSLQYTFTRAYFDNEFSSILEDWGVGTIRKGDPLPYIPSHQVNVRAGVRWYPWQLNVNAKYQSMSYDQALADGRLEVPASRVLDLTGSFFTDWGQEIYANVENLTDAKTLVSYRPFGARPGKPRSYILGTKASF